MILGVLGKVPAGFVLACEGMDLAPETTTHLLPVAGGRRRIYLAEKRPLGLLFWGLEFVGSDISTETAARIQDWEEKASQPLSELVNSLARSLYERLKRIHSDGPPPFFPQIGFFMAGFEIGQDLGRDWVWDMSPLFSPPRPVRSGRSDEPQYGFNWRGQMELWLTRLILGYDPTLLDLLKSDLGLAHERLISIVRKVEMAVSYSGMGLEQAMEFASFLIQTAQGLYRLHAPRRGWNPRIELATITPQGAHLILPKEKEEGSEQR